METIAVTGASGFLAQHLIRELQSNEAIVQTTSELRLIDRRPFEKFLEYPESIRSTFHRVDMATESDRLRAALDGATAVFHLAARRYDFGMFPDDDLYWMDNFEAVRNLCDIMTRQSSADTGHSYPRRLVFAGDAFANSPPCDQIGASDYVLGAEPPLGRYLLGIYGKSKWLGEKWAKEAFRRAAEHDAALSCAIIRPTLIYGEGDTGLVPAVTDIASNCTVWGFPPKTLPYIGDGNGGRFHMIYAGNAAHLLIKAYEYQKAAPADINAEVTFGIENAPAEHILEFLSPILREAGCSVSSRRVNYYVAFCCAALAQAAGTLAGALLPASTAAKLVGSWPNWTVVRMAAAWVFGFDATKARTFIDYVPKYEPEQAQQATVDWWRTEFDRRRRLTQ